MGSGPAHLRFFQGTLELRGELGGDPPRGCAWDERTQCHRAPAVDYASIVLHFQERGIELEDAARDYEELDFGLRVEREPWPFQSDALAAWREQTGRGVVVLPTGAGKTHVGVMAIDAVRRSTLVVVPTLDLVRQWYDLLRVAFDTDIGVIGGGEYDVQPLTVTTYDSAYIHVDHLGHRFGFVIFDECHHLPGESYSLSAQGCLAPFRLGLSATPERVDGRDALLTELIGPTVYRRDVVEMTGQYLADYEVQRIHVDLSEDERAAYEEARAIYRGFVRDNGIRMGASDGWTRFIILSSLSRDGRAAMAAYQKQRQLAFCAPSKLEVLDRLLHRHRGDRALVFTQDNATAYAISRRFLIPAITHQTKVTERSEILRGLAEGTYGAVSTSKVLNEGVDVPAASVAIIVSGSGSVREHVQRLGRVLRRNGDQRAVLYELIADDTSETYTSDRRRDHVAYR